MGCLEVEEERKRSRLCLRKKEKSEEKPAIDDDSDADFMISSDEDQKVARVETELAAVEHGLNTMHLNPTAKRNARRTIAELEQDMARMKQTHSQGERQHMVHQMKAKTAKLHKVLTPQ